jgi:hypothetical protein
MRQQRAAPWRRLGAERANRGGRPAQLGGPKVETGDSQKQSRGMLRIELSLVLRFRVSHKITILKLLLMQIENPPSHGRAAVRFALLEPCRVRVGGHGARVEYLLIMAASRLVPCVSYG